MRTTIRVTDPNFEMPSLDDLSHGDQLEASYALRGIRHHQKEIEEHRKLLRREVNTLRKLIKKLDNN